MLDEIVVVAASAVVVAAAVRGVVAFVVSAARASARAVDFSPHWRSALCTVDAPDPAAAGVFAAVDPASWPDLPAVFDTSDLIVYFRYWGPPDADTRADLSDARDYSCALLQLRLFPYPAPLHAR